MVVRLEFRRASVEDIDILVERRMAMRAEREESSCTIDMGEFRELTKRFFSKYIPDGSFIAWLAVEEGAVIGTSGLCIHRVPPTYGNPWAKVGYIVNMYTAPEYRGRGVGAALLDKLMEEARSQGCGRVALNTSEAGRRLYEKYGFSDVPNEMEYFLD